MQWDVNKMYNLQAVNDLYFDMNDTLAKYGEDL